MSGGGLFFDRMVFDQLFIAATSLAALRLLFSHQSLGMMGTVSTFRATPENQVHWHFTLNWRSIGRPSVYANSNVIAASRVL
jgi:hypothetical protein